MTSLANILALATLSSDTPDEVLKAARLMIIGGDKNPRLSAIASADVVEKANKAAAEAAQAAGVKDGDQDKVIQTAALMAIRERLNIIETEISELSRALTDLIGDAPDAKQVIITQPARGGLLETILGRLTRNGGKNGN